MPKAQLRRVIQGSRRRSSNNKKYMYIELELQNKAFISVQSTTFIWPTPILANEAATERIAQY